MATVYIISGPAGVGKSTTSAALAKALPASSLISGDVVSWMHKNGREKPWLSEREVELIWDNILSLAKNFIKREIDVVIDYVTFPKQAYWFVEQVRNLDVEVRYIVFTCDAETLLARDRQRPPAYQMGIRCLELIEEFKAAKVPQRFIINNTYYTLDQLPQLLDDIQHNEQYLLTST